MSNDIQYPDNFIERLHSIWGMDFCHRAGRKKSVRLFAVSIWSEKPCLISASAPEGPPLHW